MNSRPISIRNIDASRVTFVPSIPKPGRNPSINFKYDGQNLNILVPRAMFPGGVLSREDNQTGKVTYTLLGSFGEGVDKYAKEPAPESAGDLGKLYNVLTQLDEAIIHAAVENSVKWFGKKRSEEALRDAYKRMVSVSNDKVDGEYVPNGKYPPSFKLKVPVYDNKVSTEIVNASRNPLYATPESLTSIFPKRVEASVVISGSIYVMAGGGFGVTWRLNMAQVFPSSKLSAESVFDAEDETGGETENVPAPTQEATPVEDSAPPLDVEIPESPDEPPVTQAPPPPAPRKRKAAGAL